MRRPGVLLALALLVGALPSRGEAQAGSCDLLDNQFTERRVQNGFSTVFIQGPLLVRCAGGAEIRAQVGTLYQATNEIHLSGSVSFRDTERQLTSDNAVYTSATGRLFATGNVVFTDLTEGMTLRGPELEYFRAMAGRPQTQAIATQRPNLTLRPRARPGATGGASGEPYLIDADRMTMVGNEQYTAIGRVEIRRSDIRAFGNEARVDQVAQRMELRGRARVEGEQFDLRGEAIDLFTPDDRLERVHARRDSELVGDDLRLDADDIQMFFADDLLQRMVARRDAAEGARPVATARAFRLEADSIDAVVPEQRLERVIAIGAARGESLDTTNAPQGRIAAAAPAGSLTSGERDWILGDTVTAFFVAAPPADSAVLAAADTVGATGSPSRDEVVLDRLLAIGDASSLYRVENDRNGADGEPLGPGLNYLAGEMIELTFQAGQLDVADVRGLRRGLYLDPVEVATPAGDAPATPAPAALSTAPRPRRR